MIGLGNVFAVVTQRSFQFLHLGMLLGYASGELRQTYRIRYMNLRCNEMLDSFIFFAGWGQLILVLGSLAIPKILKWKEDTAKLRPLTRQVFWTYAGYIWGTNLSFAILSILSPHSLTDGSILATAVSAFILVYWAARVVIQFTYFDKSDAPKGTIFAVAEYALNGLFLFLVCVYGWALWANFVNEIPGTGN